ncbi:hypothetical protein A6A08_19175 [Nocardiopsis sp. TSRI0078]|uniref:nitroreductase/quinone reductase family protein n=1 Tax=unclassified Nocardiopsis TaxID=2649073 RepID=UPI00093BF1A5|nr:nitroreductase/quinone reductase family protein [Nocardiopsis sp. TSRI0078]OKI22394.1 hypothetical protein A6A08_19175 [Nocardiopsis sp. TSRI0078]
METTRTGDAAESTVNSNPFNLQVIERFRAGGGRVEGFEGKPLLLLTTRGARSGLMRTTPLVYLENGSQLVVFAANGGAATDPNWFRNLMASGAGSVEVGQDTYTVRPVLVDEADQEDLWERQTAQDPNFADFRRRTDRSVPVVALVPAADNVVF